MHVTVRLAIRRLPCWGILCAGWLGLMTVAPVAWADSTMSSSESPSSVEYHKGLAKLATGDLEEAQRSFEASIALDKQNVEAYLGLGETALRQQRTEEAAAYLKKAMALAPKDARTQRAWGRYLSMMKQHDEAEKAFVKATSLDPGFVEAQMDLGDLRATVLKKHREAADAYREATRFNTKSLRAHHALAVQLVKIESFQEAHEAYRKSRGLAPKNPQLAYEEGSLYVREGRPDQALTAFEAAVEAKPTYVPALLARADLLRSVKHRPDEAAVNYQAVLTQEPNNVRAHVGLGLTLKLAGKNDEALAHLKEATRLAPRDPSPWYELGRLHVRSKKFTEAAVVLETALRADPKFLPAVVEQADVQSAQGQFAKAQEGYVSALQLAPRDSTIHVKLGQAHYHQRQWADAQRAFLKAVELSPEDADALNSLAWMAAERGKDLDNAVEWSRKAVKIQPRNASFTDTQGWVYRARGELAKAAQSLREAAMLNPNDPVIHYHLGVVYGEQRNTKQAKGALQKALSLQADFEGSEDARRRLADLAG